MFCTDDHCSFPLHTLVTDVVDSQPLPLSLSPSFSLSLPPSLQLKVVKQRDKSETLFRCMLKEDKEGGAVGGDILHRLPVSDPQRYQGTVELRN